MNQRTSNYDLRSLLLSVVQVIAECGKSAFKFTSPSDWNSLPKELRLKELLLLNIFRELFNDLRHVTTDVLSD